MIKEQRVSYSALADLDQCSMKFYLGRILGLPQKTWDKTTIGSLIHAILECLAKSRHRKHHDLIVRGKSVRYENSAAITRLINRWTIKHNIKPELLSDINSMLEVALIHTDFFFTGAIKIYPPEHEFIVDVGGARLKGFIDSMADMGDYFLVRDWKSAGSKMSKADVQNSFQTRMYQWYVRRQFGKSCVVEYIFLRHGPTVRTPEKHIMRVQPSTELQERGFEYYATSMYPLLNSFGEREAHSNFCGDFGFCERVCSYRFPFSYYSISKPDGSVRTIWIDPKNSVDKPPELEYDETVRKLSHRGCPKYNH